MSSDQQEEKEEEEKRFQHAVICVLRTFGKDDVRDLYCALEEVVGRMHNANTADAAAVAFFAITTEARGALHFTPSPSRAVSLIRADIRMTLSHYQGVLAKCGVGVRSFGSEKRFEISHSYSLCLLEVSQRLKRVLERHLRWAVMWPCEPAGSVETTPLQMIDPDTLDLVLYLMHEEMCRQDNLSMSIGMFMRRFCAIARSEFDIHGLTPVDAVPQVLERLARGWSYNAEH